MLLAALLMFSPLPAAAPECAPAHLEACTNTNELIISDAFLAALRRFAGRGRAGWLYPNGKVADQLIDVLHGPPDDAVKLADGLIRFAACRAHSCPEKGAAFLSPDGTIRGVAILHFACARADACDDDYTLTLVTRTGGDALMADAREWAEGELKAEAADYPNLPHARIAKSETVVPK